MKYLLTSGVFNWEQYAKTFNQLLSRHYNNFGVNNYSVAQSSFDTWLDGYVKGAPGRKGSIYTEGALIAFMTDIFILQNTNNKKSLADVMKILYQDFAKKEKGVFDTDYKNVIEQVAGVSYEEIYTNFLHGTTDYTKQLKESLNYIGCDLKVDPSENYNEAYLGFMVRYEADKCSVDNIYPKSIAEENGLSINDELIAINGIKIINDLSQWSEYFKGDEIALSVKKELGVIEKIKLKKRDTVNFKSYTILKNKETDNFKAWSK